MPEAPLSDEVLVCEVLEPGVDPDGETVIHLFAWLQNGEDASETGDTISAFKTATGDQWTCQVNAWDGTLQSEPVQVTVLIGE